MRSPLAARSDWSVPLYHRSVSADQVTNPPSNPQLLDALGQLAHRELLRELVEDAELAQLAGVVDGQLDAPTA